MTKQLQKKFVITAMAAISVLLVVVLSALNIANAVYAGKQASELATILCQDRQFPQRPGRDPLSPFDPMGAQGAAVYFRAELDTQLNLVRLDLGRIQTLEQEDALKMLESVLDSSRTAGYLDGYYFSVGANRFNQIVIVFLDITNQIRSILQVLALSLVIGVVCWGLMLVLVILLSKRAITPMAANFEKQKQFVTDAGHDIKTPLAIILANTDALELHLGENKWSKNIRTQILRLNGLMQNLLTLSKAEEAYDPAEFDRFSISNMVQDMVEAFQEPANMAQVELHTDIHDNLFINGNRDLLQRLVSILLDNAVKYTPSGGEIWVDLAVEDKKTVLRMKNTWETTDAIDPQRLFDRFYRSDAARTQKNGGYGIGLSAARAIVEMHRGSITAHNGPDNTIIFTVKL